MSSTFGLQTSNNPPCYAPARGPRTRARITNMIATDVLLKLHDWASGEIPTSELPAPEQVAEAFRVCADLLYELEQACLSLDELAKEYVEGIGHNATARGVREQTRRARAAIEKAKGS